MLRILLLLPHLGKYAEVNRPLNHVRGQAVQLRPDKPHVVYSNRGEGEGSYSLIISSNCFAATFPFFRIEFA